MMLYRINTWIVVTEYFSFKLAGMDLARVTFFMPFNLSWAMNSLISDPSRGRRCCMKERDLVLYLPT